MYIKYLVKKEDDIAVIKFNIDKKKVQIGGYARFFNLITLLINKPYFSSVVKENTHTQRNKMRFEGTITMEKFIETIDMVSQDFDVEKTQRVGRLI
jgi:tRNA1(Val) A37 N6-methylase TrmN6